MLIRTFLCLSCLAFTFPPDTLQERFPAPKGYTTVRPVAGSFQAYLSQLPLRSAGSHAYNYRDEIAHTDEYTAAVVNFPKVKRDLQQCADAIIRLRAEYLWSKKLYEQISFNFTSGFRCGYKKYAQGYRYRDGKWVKKAREDYSYATFQQYLDLVYSYAGTLSLEKELKKAQKLEIGNIFIKGGSPGHCFIVVNICVRQNDTLFQLAQSYMPAQDIQILKDDDGSWFTLHNNPDLPYAELIERKYMRKFD